MKYDKFPSISYVLSLPLWSGKVKYGLELPEKLLVALSNPQDKLKVVHVGGTNGKGSTCALIAAMLYAEGYKVCQFLSPHLTNICERCTINGRPIEPEKFDKALERVRRVSEENGLEPSFFVYTHVATILCALEEKVDYLVLEVGVGGRLDATNVLAKPLATVITSVGLDHMNILGDTEYQIARDKAGIFKKGAPVFVGRVSEEARRGIEEVVGEVGVECEFVGDILDRTDLRAGTEARPYELKYHVRADNVRGQRYDRRGGPPCPPAYSHELDLIRLQLKGEHQHNNAILAARVAHELGVSSASINRGLEICRFPGRLESFEFEGKRVLLDIAHNPQGMEALVGYVGARCARPSPDGTGARSAPLHYGGGKIIFLISILDRKDPDTMLSILHEAFKERASYIFSQSKHPNSLPAEVLAESLIRRATILCGHKETFTNTLQIEILKDSAAALQKALEIAGEKDLIVVTGSLFFVAEIREMICGEAFSTIVL